VLYNETPLMRSVR